MLADFFGSISWEPVGFVLFVPGIVTILAIQFSFYFRLALPKAEKQQTLENSISVLLYVHNEQSRIEPLISQLLKQTYRAFEIVVVDLFSEDDTVVIVEALARKYSNVKISMFRDVVRQPEKMGINLALKAAASDWVVFLPPSASELSPVFLQKINDETASGSSVSVNYCNYSAGKGFCRLWCRMERFFSFLTTAAWAKFGIPLFFQQVNVLFRRDLYFESSGFKGMMNLNYANLELVFNRAGKMKIAVSFVPETFVNEDDCPGLSDFGELVQKRIMIKNSLTFGKRLLLSMEDVGTILVVSGLIWLLAKEREYWLAYAVPTVVALALHLFIVRRVQRRLNERGFFLPSLIYMVVRPLVNLYQRFVLAVHLHKNRWT